MFGGLKNRFWLGLMSTISFVCMGILLIFGYSYLIDETIKEVLKDIKLILVLVLLVIVFLLWMFNVFLGTRRVYKNKKKRKANRMVTLVVTIVTMIFLPLTALTSIGYVSYANYPGAKPYEQSVILGYKNGIEEGVRSLERSGAWPGCTAVAHALGAIDGYAGTESWEAFEYNYNKGFRTFELDLIMTKDGKVAIRHNWDEKNGAVDILTADQFKSTKINDKYTPLLFTDICTLLQKYQDAWIITDCKEDAATVYGAMVEEAKEMGAEEVLDRLVIQFFNADIYNTVIDIYPFKSWIFGTYAYWDGDADNFYDICEWCVENKVDSISLWYFLWTEEVQAAADHFNLDVYVHTNNNLDEVLPYLQSGVRGTYTDYIDPSSLES